MGKLVKFGEYFYDRDPSVTIKIVTDRFLRTGFLSKKNITDLKSIGISSDEFLKINEDLEFCKDVKVLLSDVEECDLFNNLLFELEAIYDYATFNLFTSNIYCGLEPRSSARGYRRNFEKISVELDIEKILLKVLNEKNNSDRSISMSNNKIRNNGNFQRRKTNWFDIDVDLRLVLTFEMQSIYRNTASFGYNPLSNISKRVCNILSNDVMFKFLKLNEIDKFDVKCLSGGSNSSYSLYQTFEIVVKRSEKSAEQSADFFI